MVNVLNMVASFLYRPLGDTRKPKPSTGFLITLNGLLFFAAVAIGSEGDLFRLILAVPLTGFFMGISALYQGPIMIGLLEKRRLLKPFPRLILFLAPLWVPMVATAVGLSVPRPANKQKPAISPDGRYEAYVYSPPEGWHIEIDTRDGKTVWDKQTDFVSHLNVYWIWGEDGRFWLYNSDISGIYYVEPDSSMTWKMEFWGTTWEPEKGRADIRPPMDLLPGHARDRFKNVE